MNYPLKNKARKQNRLRQLSFLFLILAVVITIRLFAPQFLSDRFFSAARIFWNMRDVFEEKITQSVAYFYSKALLSSENSSLKEYIAGQSDSVLQNKILRAENAKLKDLLGRKIYDTTIVAGVLAKPPRTLFDIILIDVGEKSGVSKGMSVVSGKALIGQVVEVSENISKVSLYSRGSQVIDGIVDRTNTSISLKGKGGGNFEAEVPRSFDIKVGDSLYLSGFDGALIAEVFFVDADPSAAFKKVLMRNPVNISTLRFVEILKSKI